MNLHEKITTSRDAGKEEMLSKIEKLMSSPRWKLDHWWEGRKFLITGDKAWQNMDAMHDRRMALSKVDRFNSGIKQ
jgi:hypothetical protein